MKPFSPLGFSAPRGYRNLYAYLISITIVRAARSIARRRAPQASHADEQKVDAGGFGRDRVPLATSSMVLAPAEFLATRRARQYRARDVIRTACVRIPGTPRDAGALELITHRERVFDAEALADLAQREARNVQRRGFGGFTEVHQVGN
jgi:hypothetical protein